MYDEDEKELECEGLHMVPEDEDENLHEPSAECSCDPQLMKCIDEGDDGTTVVEARIWVHKRCQ